MFCVAVLGFITVRVFLVLCFMDVSLTLDAGESESMLDIQRDSL